MAGHQQRKRVRPARRMRLAVLVLACVCSLSVGAVSLPKEAGLAVQSASSQTPESELQTGIALTAQGHFTEAIPHLLAAQGHVSDEYAATFDLALCYTATSQFDPAIHLLTELRSKGFGTADVDDLLAQAYVGGDRAREALEAFSQAVQQDPQKEKLYLLVADACLDHRNFDLGMQIANIGLQHLPNSARLHYERATFFAFQNEPDLGKADYKAAAKLAPGTDIYYMAAGQSALLDGNIAEAIRVSRDGIRAGHANYVVLTILGSAVVRSGAAPGTPDFVQGQEALKKAIVERPNSPASHIALGELYIATGELERAISQLEKARELAPQDPAVYSQLAIAYRRLGNTRQEEQALSVLSKLNEAHTEKYRQGPPGDKAGYGASARPDRKPSTE